MRATVLAAALLAAAPAAAAPFSDVIVFGDSLSDVGNAQIGAAVLGLPDPTPAAVGYFDGRFSNGEIYVDLLRRELTGNGRSEPFAPILFDLPPPSGLNFAVGGARSVTNADPSLDLEAQLALYTAYVAETGGGVDPDALYIVNFGSNDVRAVIQGAADAPDLAVAVSNVLLLTNLLYASGATHVLVANVGDLGAEPVFNGVELAARAASDAFNDILAEALGTFADTGTYELEGGRRFTFFDTFAWGDAVIADPAAFGLPSAIDLETPCFAVPSALPDCAGYAWADTIHPSSAVHAALGRSMLAALELPAPAALALFGLGVAGLAARRR